MSGGVEGAMRWVVRSIYLVRWIGGGHHDGGGAGDDHHNAGGAGDDHHDAGGAGPGGANAKTESDADPCAHAPGADANAPGADANACPRACAGPGAGRGLPRLRRMRRYRTMGFAMSGGVEGAMRWVGRSIYLVR